MKTCWEILEIPPTNDVEAVKRAHRVLMKRWHPDTVMDPSKKAEYTTRSAEINAACDEATKVATNWSPIPTGAPGSDAGRPPFRVYNVRYDFAQIGCLSLIAFFVVLVAIVRLLPLASMFAFAAGLMVAAFLDGIFYLAAVRLIVSSIQSAKTRRFVGWLLLLGFNAVIAQQVLPRLTTSGAFNLGFLLALPLWILRRRR